MLVGEHGDTASVRHVLKLILFLQRSYGGLFSLRPGGINEQLAPTRRRGLVAWKDSHHGFCTDDASAQRQQGPLSLSECVTLTQAYIDQRISYRENVTPSYSSQEEGGFKWNQVPGTWHSMDSQCNSLGWNVDWVGFKSSRQGEDKKMSSPVKHPSTIQDLFSSWWHLMTAKMAQSQCRKVYTFYTCNSS